jgi:hypothetical protein
MPMTEYTGDTNTIETIGTTVEERGLTTEEFKAKFSLDLKAFVTWFNSVHKTEFDAQQASSGTWLPALKGSATSGTHTYSTRAGRYYKIGKLVVASFNIALTAKDAAMAGSAVLIDGLPFAVLSGASPESCSIGRFENIDLLTNYLGISGVSTGGGTTIGLFQYGDNIAYAALLPASITATTSMVGSIVYQSV